MQSIEFFIKCKLYIGCTVLIYIIVLFYFNELPAMPKEPCNCHARKYHFNDPLKGLAESKKLLVENVHTNKKVAQKRERKNEEVEENKNSKEVEEELEQILDLDAYSYVSNKEVEVVEEELSEEDMYDPNDNPVFIKTYRNFKLDLTNLVQSLVSKVLLIQLRQELQENMDSIRRNNTSLLFDRVKTTIDSFNTNFHSKVAYLMYLKEIIWRECKLENFILASLNEHNPKVDYIGSNSKKLTTRRISGKNVKMPKDSFIDFNIKVEMYNDFLIDCNIFDYGVKQ